jgi:hypothetical protein
MAKPLILKKAYKGLNQTALVTFADNVVKRMSSKPEYQAYSSDVTLLGQQVTAYAEALSKAVNRATDNVALKEEIKASLLQTLDRITDQLNLHHTGLESWGINAGMEVMREKVLATGDLQPPGNLQVLSRGIRGEAILSFKVLEPTRVRNNGAEYSEDGGVNWKNGTYSSNSTIRLKGLPSRQTVLFRVCSIGTFQRKSAWTEPVEAFVV